MRSSARCTLPPPLATCSRTSPRRRSWRRGRRSRRRPARYPGATFRMDVTGRGDVAIGSYLEVAPPHRVVFTWAWEGDTTPGSQPGAVEVTLTPDGDGTLVRLIHRGVAPANQQHSAAGWAHYLDRLARAVTGQDPGPDPWAEPVTTQSD